MGGGNMWMVEVRDLPTCRRVLNVSSWGAPWVLGWTDRGDKTKQGRFCTFKTFTKTLQPVLRNRI